MNKTQVDEQQKEQKYLKAYQEKNQVVIDIFIKSYYDIYFVMVETLTGYYITFGIYAESLRLMQQENIDYMLQQFASAYGVTTYEIKMIIDTDYLDLRYQVAHWKKKRAETKNENIIPFIDEQISIQEQLQDKSLTEKYYIKVFGDSEKETLKNAYTFMGTFSSVLVAVPMNEVETKKMLKYEHNPLEKRRITEDEED